VPKATKSDLGQAAEFFVASDLMHRGLEVTKPLNINGPDDLHVRASGRWWNVQAKHGALNMKTHRLHCKKSKAAMTSDILAVVHLPTKRVDYVSLNGNELPLELV
jgi:hypothetical protein